ncbi:MAG: hypothetical protein E7373_02250 [Clostridiales bacterium]|nr:hypothetical protein [Clostridiales bacterium]
MKENVLRVKNPVPITVFKIIVLTSIIISVILIPLMFVNFSDKYEKIQTFETKQEVYNSKGYSAAKQSVEKILEKETINNIESISWLLQGRKATDEIVYLKITYDSNQTINTKYFCYLTYWSSLFHYYTYDLEEITNKQYEKELMSWLTISDEEKSLLAREKSYDEFAISVILEEAKK